jgi:hypothetical protein
LYSVALLLCEVDIGPPPRHTLASGGPVLVAPVSSLSFEPVGLGWTVGTIFSRCLTRRAARLRRAIQSIVARRLGSRTVLLAPLRSERLFGLATLLLQGAFARPVLLTLARGLPGRLGAAATLRLPDAAGWRLVVDGGCILWRHFLCGRTALLLRDTFLLSHRSTRGSHQGDNGAGYQQVGSIHLGLLGFLKMPTFRRE